MNDQIKNGTASVAWYKLAELVNRGEKEKVLNLYRLLSHSFSDKAYALQVEGDILWSFHDGAALEKYEQAAYLYEQDYKFTAAIAVCEHLFMLNPKNYDYLFSLIKYYAAVDWVEKFSARFGAVLRLLDLKKFPQEQVEQLINDLYELCAQKSHEHNRVVTSDFISQYLRRENASLAIQAEQCRT